MACFSSLYVVYTHIWVYSAPIYSAAQAEAFGWIANSGRVQNQPTNQRDRVRLTDREVWREIVDPQEFVKLLQSLLQTLLRAGFLSLSLSSSHPCL